MSVLRRPRAVRGALALAATVAAGAVAPAGATAALLPPSLSPDTSYAAPSGIARFDAASGTSADRAEAIAVSGDRSYTVGTAALPGGNTQISIHARRRDGSPDPGFSDDGHLLVGVAVGNGTDLANGIAVLPDGRLRIAGAFDDDPGAPVQLDAVVIGLLPDGSDDLAFGAAGRTIVGSTDGDEELFDIAVHPDTGRLAVAGRRAPRASGQNDTLVGLLEPSGGIVTGFGLDGIRELARAQNNLDDTAVDVVFSGDRIVALLSVETNPAVNIDDSVAVLRAFGQDGNDDGGFGTGGEAGLGFPGAETLPSALIVHDGRLWMTGCTRPAGGADRLCAANESGATDADGFLARVNADGGDLQSRRFDLRGSLIQRDQAVLTEVNDLAIVPGVPTSLAVVGSVGYTFSSDRRSDWAAAAFNNLSGDLSAANFGEIALETPNRANRLTGLAAYGPNAFAVAGYLDAEPRTDPSGNPTVIIDTSFGNARLLIDAEKRCNLQIRFTAPLELVLTNRVPSAARFEVRHAGTRPCAGVVDVPAPFAVTTEGRPGPIPTGMLTPGDVFSAPDVQVSYVGPRPITQAVLRANLAITDDVDEDPRDNAANLLARFSYCDVAASRLNGGTEVPNEGRTFVEVQLRNTGTVPCPDVRAAMTGAFRLGSPFEPFILRPGRAASDRFRLVAPRRARPGRDLAYAVTSTTAAEDLEPANNALALTARVVGVGDTNIRKLGRKLVSGTARAGRGSTDRRSVRVRRVEVAFQRVRKGRCQYLASVRGRLVTTGRNTKRCRPVWLRTKGTSRWKLALRLDRTLRSSRFIVTSRAVTRNGFAEDRFSARDRNKKSLRSMRRAARK
jgi:hypothetical protein